MVTSHQIRGARAMIAMKQADLAKAAGISLATLNNIERGVSDPKASTLAAIQRALEAAGVEFIERGVRLKP
nr:helix-turn-helix transcriptional regulator [Paramagnetospirillum magneticum]